ncbi:N-acetylmuramoyl-L-alanine amidase [Paenibacillus roseipurpureus]|uniref:N-acetylmuramoyl-L-alanine amidase n=1 Tax=Paenibacillus roseopurpureus TaxID=2918901 RepID=A0AA96LQC0_9BACL|nr:N-acetylmuramoyl-L-alanine amidase [Paenibacillus sp. MBLB1832]WNR46322.1 N-acetylmuramoyl-L-alanine amidase [Paenibacillus sp. MBLB1832]
MLSVEDANKIIAFLSAAYFATDDGEARKEFNRLANELRKASGQPAE